MLFLMFKLFHFLYISCYYVHILSLFFIYNHYKLHFFLLLKRNRYKCFIKNFVNELKIIVKMFAVIKIVFIFVYN